MLVVTPEDLESGKHSSVLGILEMLLFITAPQALQSNLFMGSESNCMERWTSIAVQSTDSEVRLLVLETQLCHFPAVWSWEQSDAPRNPGIDTPPLQPVTAG